MEKFFASLFAVLIAAVMLALISDEVEKNRFCPPEKRTKSRQDAIAVVRNNIDNFAPEPHLKHTLQNAESFASSSEPPIYGPKKSGWIARRSPNYSDLNPRFRVGYSLVDKERGIDFDVDCIVRCGALAEDCMTIGRTTLHRPN